MKKSPTKSHAHDKDTEQVNTFVPTEMKLRIQAAAEREQRTVSGWLRWIISKELERGEAGAAQQSPVTKTA